jgi:transcriptional regulator with XRE-family HTH domain
VARNKRKTSAVDILIGSNLRSIRTQCGKSQTQVGEFLDVSFQQIQKYEKGTNRIAVATLHQLSKYFNTTMDAFMTGIETIDVPGVRPAHATLSAQGFKIGSIYDKCANEAVKRSVMNLLKSLTDSEDDTTEDKRQGDTAKASKASANENKTAA